MIEIDYDEKSGKQLYKLDFYNRGDESGASYLVFSIRTLESRANLLIDELTSTISIYEFLGGKAKITSYQGRGLAIELYHENLIELEYMAQQLDLRRHL